MEYLREVKITVSIDTNKATYEKSFEPSEFKAIEEVMEEAAEYLKDILEGMGR